MKIKPNGDMAVGPQHDEHSSILGRVWDVTQRALGRSDSGEAVAIVPSAPTYLNGKPWHVDDFRIEGNTLNIDIRDSTGFADTLKLPYDRVQVQYVNESPDASNRRLYTHVQHGPRNSYFQEPPTVLYVGDVTKSEWSRLREKLYNGHVSVVEGQAPGRGRIQNFVPKSWKFEVS